jgi:hypothetical protein
MKTTIGKTLTVIAILVLTIGIFFSGWMVARITSIGPGWMMGGYNLNTSKIGPGGMMGGAGGYGSGGMMGGNAYSNADPLTIDQMKSAAEKYIENSSLAGLEVGEIMIFDNNAYAVVMEKETGLGAFELLVDSGSQVAYPEYGPNMMWNLKYGGISGRGMMGGRGGWMMGGWNKGTTTPANVSADDMPVTQDQVFNIAQEYLDNYIPGSTAASDSIKFYGYYTMDFEQNGKVAGMLSVNGYNGQVFLHTWHGGFVEESGMN